MIKRILLFLLVLNGLFPSLGAAEKNESVTKFEIVRDKETASRGRLVIMVGGKERKIADEAIEAWSINDGKGIVYSGPDGAGGFENEGQSLRLYDVATGKTRKILSEYVSVDALMEVKLGPGETALLLKMSDGGAGASYFAVVDPKRGEVFRRPSAELTELKGNTITLAIYDDNDWFAIKEERGWGEAPKTVLLKPPKIAPLKTESHDLKVILKSKVIQNKPTNL
jgi:hypothetical protein